jgi:hypothetical protein
LQLFRLHWQQVESINLRDLATYSPKNSTI